VGSFQALDRIKSALVPLRVALDERDQWEVLGSPEESKTAALRPRAQAVSVRSSRARGARSSRQKGKFRGDLSIGPSFDNPPNSIPKNLSNQLYWVKQKFNSSAITTSATLVVETNFSFSLSLLTQVADFTAVFDQYYIAAVNIVFESNVAPGASATFGQVYTALDFNSTNNINTVAAIESYDTCKVSNLRAGKVISRSVRPCVLSEVGGVATGGVERKWLDSSNTGILHFGIRCIVTATGTVISIVPVTTLWVAFRSVI
jgi:hypothetical protein